MHLNHFTVNMRAAILCLFIITSLRHKHQQISGSKNLSSAFAEAKGDSLMGVASISTEQVSLSIDPRTGATEPFEQKVNSNGQSLASPQSELNLFDSGPSADAPSSVVSSSAAREPELVLRTVDERYPAWLQEGGFAHKTQRGRGRGFATTESVKELDAMFHVPNKIIMTREKAQQSGLKPFLEANPSISQLITLSLFVLYEKSLGEKSAWQPYIRQLPSYNDMDSTTFWTQEELQELNGTHLLQSTSHRIKTIENTHGILKRPLTTNIAELGRPIFPADISFSDFHWAISVVWGHATTVVRSDSDGQEAIMMIPIVDTMWHKNGVQNQVVMDSAEGVLRFYASKNYAPNEPIYLNIGEVTADMKLLRYGVALESNETYTGVITLSLDESDPLFQEKEKLWTDWEIPNPARYTVTLKDTVLSVPTALLPGLRIHQLKEIKGTVDALRIISVANEHRALRLLRDSVQEILKGFATTIEEDEAILARAAEQPLSYRLEQAIKYRLGEKQTYQMLLKWTHEAWAQLLDRDLGL